MNLNTPEAAALLQKLKEQLSELKIPCFAGQEFFVPRSSEEIAPTIDALREFLPLRKRGEPPLFWTIVKTLNRARPGLKLVATLKRVFEKVALITPGPFTQLMNRSDGSKELAHELAQAIEAAPVEVPSLPKLVEYSSLLRELAGDFFNGLEANAIQTKLRSLHLRQFLAYAAFLEVVRQRDVWLKKHWTTVELAYDLAVVLEHQPFIDKVAALAAGEKFYSNFLEEERVKGLARERTRRLRQRKKENSISGGLKPPVAAEIGAKKRLRKSVTNPR